MFNPLVPNAPFLYPLKTSENLKVFWYFQAVWKGCIGNEWVTWYMNISCICAAVSVIDVDLVFL